MLHITRLLHCQNKTRNALNSMCFPFLVEVCQKLEKVCKSLAAYNSFLGIALDYKVFKFICEVASN